MLGVWKIKSKTQLPIRETIETQTRIKSGLKEMQKSHVIQAPREIWGLWPRV